MQQARVDRYRIVCGVNFTHGSEHALRAAHRLALRTTPSTLHVVHALERYAWNDSRTDHEEEREHAASRLEAYVNRVLSRASDAFAGHEIVFHVRFEDVPGALDAVAREARADVIIVGASERRVLSQWWHRSGVRTLMRRAAVPVLVVRERGDSDSHVPVPSTRDGSGVYPSLALHKGEPESTAAWLDADSASSMCRMYEARTSHPDLVARAAPVAAGAEQKKTATGR